MDNSPYSPFQLDLGDLLVTDPATFTTENKQTKAVPPESEIRKRAAAAYKHLIKALLELKGKQRQLAEQTHAHVTTDAEIDHHLVTLPPMTTRLPRQNKPMEPKPPTKWQLFCQSKGIDPKKKKSRMVWDEASKDWVPRWGFKSKKQRDEKREWLIEEKQGEAPYEGDDDPFLRKSREKKLKMAKQKTKEIKNKIKASKNSVKTSLQLDKQGLNTSLAYAQKSTASLGKFDKQLKNEQDKPKPKIRQKIEFSHKDYQKQKDRNLRLLEGILKKKEKKSDNSDNLVKYGNKSAK